MSPKGAFLSIRDTPTGTAVYYAQYSEYVPGTEYVGYVRKNPLLGVAAFVLARTSRRLPGSLLQATVRRLKKCSRCSLEAKWMLVGVPVGSSLRTGNK
jgi:hypothetical protein